jgi:hypothetical protein
VLPIKRRGGRTVELVAELKRIADPAAERVVVGTGEQPVGGKPVGRMIGHVLIVMIAEEETEVRRGLALVRSVLLV